MQPPSTLQRSAVLAACAQMIRSCGLTLVELAQELGQPLQAAPVVMLPTVRGPNTIRPRAEQAFEHVREAGGLGIQELMAIMGLSMQATWGYLDELQRTGRIVRVRAVGQRSTRYFADTVLAQRWVDEHAQAASAKLQHARDKLAADLAKAAEFPAPAPAAPAVVTLSPAEVRSIKTHVAKVAGSKKAPPPLGARTPKKPKPLAHQNVTFSPPVIDDTKLRPAGDAVITPATKITLDTTQRPTARWQMRQEAPDERWPSFSSVRPGVDPATGKAWESRA